MTGTWNSGETSATLSTLAYETGLPGFGKVVVVFGLLIFAYTTLLGWSYYGERCAEYIFGVWIIKPYRYAWIGMIFVGALLKDKLALLWDISDALNGLMALPNIVALLLLSPVIFRITQEYFENEKKK